MINRRLKHGLEECIAGGRCRFMTYGEFGRDFKLGNYAPAWANRMVLDAVSTACRNDSDIGLDLTFLLRNGRTRYPSVVDGKAFNRDNPGPQIIRAREEAQRIIDKFCPGTQNPY